MGILKKVQAGEASRTWCITLLKRDERLDMKVDQRSCDFSLGLPNDVFAMAVLLHLVCQSSAGEGRAKVLTPGRLCWTFGHLHIYDNSLEETKSLLERLPKPRKPQLRICSDVPLLQSLFTSAPELPNQDLWKEFKIIDYDPHPKIMFKSNGRQTKKDCQMSTDQKPDSEQYINQGCPKAFVAPSRGAAGRMQHGDVQRI